MEASVFAGLKVELDAFVGRFADCFSRRDTRSHLTTYVSGQLSDVHRKNVEAMALAAGVPVRTLQEFLSQHRWNEDLVRQRLQEIVRDEHAHEHSIGIIDETSDDKKGVKTPGVQRQHLGCSGKQDNGIVTVHLAYAADNFHCLLDGELFLPQGWSDDRPRCREAGIPDDMVYRPKTDIALELYDRAKANGVKFSWLTFDEWYGVKPAFLQALNTRGQSFVGETHCHFVAWSEEPLITSQPYRKPGRPGRSRKTPRLKANSPQSGYVGDLVQHKPVFTKQTWQQWHLRDGDKGSMVWEAKRATVWVKGEDGLPTDPWQLLVCRNVTNPGEVKYFVSNASAKTPTATLLLVAFSRWRVERCFQDDKSEVGLDHYEGRRYVGLKRHLILSAVSLLFLSRVNQRLREKKSGMDGLPGSQSDLRRRAVVMA